MTDCVVCGLHSGIEKDITKLSLLLEERKELMNVRLNQIQQNVTLAKQEMDRRLEGMNGLEARTTARTAEAEGRVREQTAVAERKLAEQAAHFITRKEVDTKVELVQAAIAADVKVLSGKIDTLVSTSGFSTGARRWSDHILTVLIAAGVMLLFKFLRV
jgi:hypothetical protein